MMMGRKKKSADDELKVEPTEDVSEAAETEEATPLNDSEKQQFAEWLEKQPPDRRKHYLKLARAYGFPEE